MNGTTSNAGQRKLEQATSRVLVILALHKVGEPSVPGWDTWNYISETRFTDCLGALRDYGWSTISAAALLQGLAKPERLPERAALLTFDDGYRSTYEVALPWLRRFRYPAVVFVPTAFVGDTNTFDAGIEPEEAICGWRELKELERFGVSVQSHGVTHRPFSTLSVGEQQAELLQSKHLLEKGLSKRVDIFAYPYGDEDTGPGAACGLLKAVGYNAACLYQGGPISGPLFSDRYRLTRVPIGPDTDLGALLG